MEKNKSRKRIIIPVDNEQEQWAKKRKPILLWCMKKRRTQEIDKQRLFWRKKKKIRTTTKMLCTRDVWSIYLYIFCCYCCSVFFSILLMCFSLFLICVSFAHYFTLSLSLFERNTNIRTRESKGANKQTELRILQTVWNERRERHVVTE